MIFTPTNLVDDDYNECQELSINIDWDEGEQDWHGELDGHDLKYYFENDDTGCYLKLRSTSLGYPEGYEAAWSVGHGTGDISCDNPITEVGVSGDECTAGIIATSCAEMYVPHNCTGCGCACECLCVTYTKGDCVTSGKACNDGLGNWRVTLNCGDYGPDIEIVISMFPRNITCDPYVDPYCDPDDKTCILFLSLGSDTQQPAAASCPDIGGSWTISEYGEDDATITARCAVCTEDCENEITPCCDGFLLPETVYVTLEVFVERVCDDPPFYYDHHGLCATYVFTLTKGPGTDAIWGPSAAVYSSACACLGSGTVYQQSWTMLLFCSDGTGTSEGPGPRKFYLSWNLEEGTPCGTFAVGSAGVLQISCSPFLGVTSFATAPGGNYCCTFPELILGADHGCHGNTHTFRVTVSG